jgi:CheY-like chemotaxis protein
VLVVDADVALVDIMMPDLDGYETTRAIRRDPRVSAIPIVAVTARAMKDDREKCLAAGASDYLPKPIDTALLLGTIRRLVAG